jgi:thioredoxin 1
LLHAWWKAAIVVALLVAVVAVLQVKTHKAESPQVGDQVAQIGARPAPPEEPAAPPLADSETGPKPASPPESSPALTPKTQATTKATPKETPAKATADAKPQTRASPAPKSAETKPKAEPKPKEKPKPEAAQPQGPKPAGLPRLVEVGADQCIPCKMMQPILAELRREYEGKLRVEFVDVWKDPSEADKYNVRVIPTQIIFDGTGKEVFRHTGFFPKDEILAKLKELGFELE